MYSFYTKIQQDNPYYRVLILAYGHDIKTTEFTGRERISIRKKEDIMKDFKIYDLQKGTETVLTDEPIPDNMILFPGLMDREIRQTIFIRKMYRILQIAVPLVTAFAASLFCVFMAYQARGDFKIGGEYLVFPFVWYFMHRAMEHAVYDPDDYKDYDYTD